MADDLFQLLEDAEQQVADEVSAVLREVADEFAHDLADATELVAARFSVSRIARMFTDRMPRIVRRLLRVAEQAADHTAEATDSELPEEWHDLEGRYDDGRDLPPAMSEYVTVTEHLLRAVGDRLAEAAREELAAGVDAGESIDQLRARLRERFAREGSQLGPDREEGIARTEAGRAWNTATLVAARDATGQDRPLVKQWVTRGDTRVRHDHREVNGTIRLLDEQFTVGTSKMDAPHDPSAPASQVVNCRCVLRVHPEIQASAFETQDDPRAEALESTAAADRGHLEGAMVALLPSEADAERLALDGGDPADELHCTMFFLGDDASQWSEGERTEFIHALEAALSNLGGPIQGHVTGTAHWNTDTEKPSWVWTISDGRDQDEKAPTLGDARWAVTVALDDTHHPEMPRQHSPWTAHVCAVYTDEPWPYEPMTERVGPVTFDWLRVAFGDEHTDIPLGPQQEEDMPEDGLQAAAELAEDFVPLTVRGWSTPDDAAIAYEDQETGDGRILMKGALKWDQQPKPIQHADEMLMGHQGARLAGAMQKVKREGNRITASGVMYLTQPAGLDAVQLLDEGAPLGISVDLDNVSIQLVDKTLTEEDADWLFASASLPQASVMHLEDGSVMLSASTRAEWTAADGAFSRSRYDLQLITSPGGTLTAAAIRQAFDGTGVLTAAAGDPDDPDSGLVIHEQKAGEFLLRITDARLRGATLVAMPAFKDARIVLDPLVETAAGQAPDITAAGETRERVIRYVCTSPAAVGARDVSRALGMAMSTARGHLNGAAKDGRIVRLAPGLFCGPSTLPEGNEATAALPEGQEPPVHEDAVAAWDGSASAELRELEASAWTAMQAMDPLPAEWFNEPTEEELPDGAGGVHIKDGRAFGWVATIDEPHAGYPGKNLTVRKLAQQGLDLSHFLRAKFQLDDGTFARVGAMTMNVGHHRDGAECETPSCQFDNTRTVGAIVTVGLNDRGLWFSGASAPWLSDWDRAVFATCQPSYHLKQDRDGTWQLRAVLTVPVPGHSTPLLAALHAVAERSNLALAASAAGLLPALDESPGHDPDAHPDDVRAASAGSTGTRADLPGQRPDTASGQHPEAAPQSVASVDVEALAAALVGGPLIDLIADAVTRRQDERRAEIAAMAALVSSQPVPETVAVQNGVI